MENEFLIALLSKVSSWIWGWPMIILHWAHISF